MSKVVWNTSKLSHSETCVNWRDLW